MTGHSGQDRPARPAGRRARMVLCAGAQSSGSTLVSWCFLQRADTGGVLDMVNDVLQVSFDDVTSPVLWCKMTVGAFRWHDVAEVYRDLGHDPVPLLVVRDLRDVFASLVTKEYGFNGVTAEEPPLRMRLRRYLADWKLFRANAWPVIRFESLVDKPRETLRRACRQLRLPWDEAMLTWPKPAGEVMPADRPGFNDTFVATSGEPGLEAAIAAWRKGSPTGPPALPERELDWLEREFAEFNAVHRYPARMDRSRVVPGGLPAPAFRSRARF